MTKTVVATHLTCGCPVYAEDLPISEWRCEHGNYWTATTPPSTLQWSSVHNGNDIWQAKRGAYRYQIRNLRGELGPWLLDIYNDANSSPGNVDVTRATNLPDWDAAELRANAHAATLQQL